jgi:cyclic pyranopterin phosphate synthase
MALTHIDDEGRAKMVDISGKNPSRRFARAYGTIKMKDSTLSLIKSNALEKGDVLGTARIAGIMAAKGTPSLIPLCHPLSITDIQISFLLIEEESALLIKSEVSGVDRSGFEMEALTGASVAALTVYDMCKAHDREMEITGLFLQEKSGGKSGTFRKERRMPF